MSEMQSRFIYSIGGLFTKNKERIQKFKQTRNSQYIYQNELDKLVFSIGTASDKT